MISLLFAITVILILFLDICKVIDFAKWSGFLFSGMLIPHFILLFYLGSENGFFMQNVISTIVEIIFAVILSVYWFWRMNFFIFRGKRCSLTRVNVLYGGRCLIYFSIYALLIQTLIYLILLPTIIENYEKMENVFLFWLDLGVCFGSLFLLLMNGVLRVLCTSRQLGITKRILVILLFWTPLVNLWILHYLCKKASEEYDYEMCRFETRMQNAKSNLCATKYPIIMIHGVGFRDLRWFNYWGRIPKELVANGAVVYYGHQEGWAVLEDNAEVIKERIKQVMQENQCDKVNLIAHSKGGLDARYAISALGMSEHVASLTTICTPHHGSQLVSVLRKMPEGLYRFVCNRIDHVFRLYGDIRPDIYQSGLQLMPEFCEEFNRKYPNAPNVYYQSYASAMSHCYSNDILCIPYMIMRKSAGANNDGLVEEKSAMWGEFMGTFHTKGIRGISHGDMIDLQREDIKGFNVVETYVKIVHELKEKGF